MAYAVLGPCGTFSEAAARAYWGPEVELLAVDNMEQMGRLLCSRRVQGALAPLHNTLTGWVDPTLQLLKTHQVVIKGQIELPVIQHLMVYRSYRCRDLEVVISHPLALKQCRDFINTVLCGIKLESRSSTAEAARGLCSEERQAACIGSQRAAQLYNLQILAANIGAPGNYTCFVHIGHRQGSCPCVTHS
ncbi:MAG: prephenate dehydratase [Syntrophomonadaceae bacterium]